MNSFLLRGLLFLLVAGVSLSPAEIISGKPVRPRRPDPREDAISRGLLKLRETQNASGSWGVQRQGGLTALVLLTYLGHGEPDNSPMYGPTVAKAAQWLLDHEAEMPVAPNEKRDALQLHDSALRAFALGEYYGLTKDERVPPHLERAASALLAKLPADGRWPDASPLDPATRPAFFWRVYALRSFQLQGIQKEKVSEGLKRIQTFLEAQRKTLESPPGQPPVAADQLAVSNAAELLLQDNRKASTPQMEAWLQEMTARKLDWGAPQADLFHYCIGTQWCVQFGGTAWRKWSTYHHDPFIAAQAADGTWPAMAANPREPLQSDPDISGQTYRTALAIFTLEYYYRYLPTSRQD